MKVWNPDDIVVFFLNKNKKLILNPIDIYKKETVYQSGLNDFKWVIMRLNKPNFPNMTKYPYFVYITNEDWENHSPDEIQEMINDGILKVYKTSEIQTSKKNKYKGEII